MYMAFLLDNGGENMKKVLMIIISAVLLTGCMSGEQNEIRIGVIQWAEHPALSDSLDGFKMGLDATGLTEKVSLEVKNANEDVGTANLIANQFVRDAVDLIFVIATPAAQAAMNAVDGTDIPVIFSAVSDAKQAGLVDDLAHPSGNLTGVSDLPPLDTQVALIQEIMPDAKNIGILYNTSEINSRNQIDEVRNIAAKLGMKVNEKGVSQANEIAIAAQQLVQETDVIYIVNDNMIASATGLVVDTANSVNKPVFMAEVGQFDQGVLASESVSYKYLGEKAGAMAYEILVNNVTIASLPVYVSEKTELYVSEAVASKLGIQIPDSIGERAVNQ